MDTWNHLLFGSLWTRTGNTAIVALGKPRCQAQSVIKQNIPAVVMEAAQGDLWYRLLPKAGGNVIGFNHFGASAPAEKLYEAFGLTAQNAVTKAKALLAKTTVESL